jgi:hypothetical protein
VQEKNTGLVPIFFSFFWKVRHLQKCHRWLHMHFYWLNLECISGWRRKMTSPRPNHEIRYIVSIYHKNTPHQLKCRLTFTDFYWKASFNKLKTVFQTKNGAQKPLFYRKSRKWCKIQVQILYFSEEWSTWTSPTNRPNSNACGANSCAYFVSVEAVQTRVHIFVFQ